MWILQASDPVSSWIDTLQSAGVLGLFVILSFAALTRRIVPGWAYDSMERDRDYYREIAHKGVELADRQIKVAEVLADRAGILDSRAAVLSRREQEDAVYTKEQTRGA